MSCKKQKPEDSNGSLPAAPLRRSCRRKKVKEEIKDIAPNSDKKTPTDLIKKQKIIEDITSCPEFKGSSPDSGISSGHCFKDKTFSKSKLSTETNILSPNKSSFVQKPQRSKKRKMGNSDDIISSNKKTKEKLSSKDVSSRNKIEKTSELEPNEISKCRKDILVSVSNMASSSSVKEESIMQVLTKHEFYANSEVKMSKTSKKLRTDNDSSSESDWEDVEEANQLSLDDYNPKIPKEGVEITIDCPELNVRKPKRKAFDHMEYIRLQINRELKEQQLNIHKTHLLCLLAHGLYMNDVMNSDSLKALALSYLPPEILSLTTGRKIDKANLGIIQNVVSWFCNNFCFEINQLPFINFEKSMPIYFEDKKSQNPSEYNLMFIVFARTLGFKARFCISFYPLSHKAKNLLKKPGSTKKNSGDSKEEHSLNNKQPVLSGKQDKKNSTEILKNKKIKPDPVKKNNSWGSANKSCKVSTEEDIDFVEETLTKSKLNKKVLKRLSNRKVVSSDSEPDSLKDFIAEEDKIVCWCEVFSKPDKQWIAVECTTRIVDKPYDIEKLLPQPITYIVAYDNDSYIKDVTKRYCSEYMTSTLKLRIDSEWWEETLEYFTLPNCKLNKEEEKKMDEILVNKPLPKTIGEFKNHPLYALKRHLLKFEAIYPPDAAPVGFIREEPVYLRDNVCKLHSRETWVKEARVVRAGEQPYKIVKARPKWDRIAGVMKTDLPLEVFGFWQTDEYEPPTAVDGKVPRNEYGNVELFKSCMLPRGTVHLRIPGLNRIAKKLGIDCSPAVVGFDGHKGSIHPVFDGFVVCKEFKDTLLAAWGEEQENARKREKEKREKRIYGNWKKLIKGLLIRERIKLKYDVK